MQVYSPYVDTQLTAQCTGVIILLLTCIVTPDRACCAQTYSVGAQVLGAVEALLLCGSALAAAAAIALWLRLRWQRSCALPCCGRRLTAGDLLTALCAAAVLACVALPQLGGTALGSAPLRRGGIEMCWHCLACAALA